MKRRSLFMSTILFIGILLMSPVVQAVTLSKGMKGDEGDILSEVSTYAGSGQMGERDGEALQAQFRMPAGLAVLPDDTVLVSDSRNHLIRHITPEEVSTFAGTTYDLDDHGFPQGAWHDDEASLALFHEPAGMSVDEEGYVYIADARNHMIRVISPDGMVSTIAGHIMRGHEDGRGEEARFYHPLDVAAASDGTLYVADTLNHLIRKITTDGQVITLNAPSTRVVEVFPGVVEWGGDYRDGPLAEALFNEPSGLAIDHYGNLYVSDTGNQLIRYIDLGSGTVTTVAGHVPESGSLYEEGELFAQGGFNDGAAAEAMFNFPRGIAFTQEEGLIIADSQNHVIRYLFDGRVSTIAGKAGEHGRADHINGHNLLFIPTDVAVMSDGSFIIADQFNHLIRQYHLYHLPHQLPLNDEVKVVVDDEVIVFDVKPELINGRVMIPVRAVAEALNYTVEYTDSSMPSVDLVHEERSLQLTIGETALRMMREGQEDVIIDMDVAPFIQERRTFAPIRFISEQLGLDVAWDGHNRTVIVRTGGGLHHVER